MHAWFGEAIADGVASGEFTVADRDRHVDRLLALIDGYGIRALIEDPAMPLERARAEIWAVAARPRARALSAHERLMTPAPRAPRPSARGPALERRLRRLDQRRRRRSRPSRASRKLARPTLSSVQRTVTGRRRPSGRR